MKILLRSYPRSWRERYGDELLALLETEPLTWRVRANVFRSGLTERLRGSGPLSLRVLWAWSVFVIGGMAFQKTSEQWQAVVPGSDRALPTTAFDTVQGAAMIGSAAVLLAVALALPGLLHDLRHGGWPVLRRPVLIAAAASCITAAGLLTVSLSHDLVVAVVFLVFATFSLFAWTHAAAVAARRLPPHRTHTYLAMVVSATMIVMTIAAAAWFASLTRHAPSFVGAGQLAVTGTFMLAALAIAGTAGIRSLRSSP
jgi:hypothetical protein